MTDLRLAVGTNATNARAEAVLDALDGTRVIIRVGHGLDPVAAVAAGALVSMVGRLHGNVEIEGDAQCGPNPWATDTVTGVLAAIADHRPTPSRAADADVTISFNAGPGDICIGGGDWTLDIGDEPSRARAASTGLGLHAAAAFAAAEVFKTALGPLGLVSVPARFEWDLLTHQFGHSDAPRAHHHAQQLLFAGAGSVNSSAAALLMNLTPGRVAVVDPDRFDAARNPYRYPAAVNSTTGPKAAWVASLLRGAGWDVEHHEAPIGTWVTDQPTPGFDGIVVSSVDSVAGRADVADILARTTLSGGVHGLALHIQREHSYDEYACPNCDFVDLGAPITQVQAVADMTGLELLRAGELIEGALLTEQDLQVVVATGRIAAVATDLVGHRLADLIGRLYAEATVTADGAEPVRVSAPFVSWMTGTLLAVEVAKASCGLAIVDRRVELDMAGIPTGAVGRRGRDQTGRCTCASPWRRRAAARMYDGQQEGPRNGLVHA